MHGVVYSHSMKLNHMLTMKILYCIKNETSSLKYSPMLMNLIKQLQLLWLHGRSEDERRVSEIGAKKKRETICFNCNFYEISHTNVMMSRKKKCSETHEIMMVAV